MVATFTAGSFTMLFVLIFAGFIITKRKDILLVIHFKHVKEESTRKMNKGMLLLAASMPVWLKWGFWVSPLTYGEIGLSVNEFLAPRWQKVILSSEFFSLIFPSGVIE